jgi:predicted nicotinamide N-methyase
MECFRCVNVGSAQLRIRELLLNEEPSENNRSDDDDDAVDAMFFHPSWNLAAATGNRVWDSCHTLVSWMLANASQCIQGKSVVELGSGCGLAGMACACLGARKVVLTDLESVLQYCTAINVAANEGIGFPEHLVSCQQLDWRDPDGGTVPLLDPEPPDVVIASDCVWLRELVPDFSRTLAALLRSPASVAYVAQLERSTPDSQTFASTPFLVSSLQENRLEVVLIQDGAPQIFRVRRQT